MNTSLIYTPVLESNCSCGNALLLESGQICDICSLPAEKHRSEPSENSAFDADYFEELEAYLEAIQSAA